MRAVKVRRMTDADIDRWIDGVVEEIGVRCPECHEPPVECYICQAGEMVPCRHAKGPADECWMCRVAFEEPDITTDDAPLWVGWFGDWRSAPPADDGSLYYGSTETEVVTAMMRDQDESGVIVA